VVTIGRGVVLTVEVTTGRGAILVDGVCFVLVPDCGLVFVG